MKRIQRLSMVKTRALWAGERMESGSAMRSPRAGATARPRPSNETQDTLHGAIVAAFASRRLFLIGGAWLTLESFSSSIARTVDAELRRSESHGSGLSAGLEAREPGRYAFVFGSFATFRASTVEIPDRTVIFIAGRDAPTDGGEGVFIFRESSTFDDGGCHLVRAIGGGVVRAEPSPRNVQWWGGVGDGVTDCSQAFQSAIESIVPTANELARGSIEIPSGRYLLTRELQLFQKGISFIGHNGTVLQWGGAAGSHMFRLEDCFNCRWSDMTILGDAARPPASGIYFDSPRLATLGTNEHHQLINVIFGYWPRRDDRRKFTIDVGLRVGGAFNGDNDQFYIDKCYFHDCREAGLLISNAQSIWGSVRDTLFDQCGYGISTGSNLTLYNVIFNRNTRNDLHVFRNIVVSAFGFNSENSVESISMHQGASLFINGGKILVTRSGVSPSAYWLNGSSVRGIALRNLLVELAAGVVQTMFVRASDEADSFVSIEDCTFRGFDSASPFRLESSPNREMRFRIETDGRSVSGRVPYRLSRQSAITSQARLGRDFGFERRLLARPGYRVDARGHGVALVADFDGAQGIVLANESRQGSIEALHLGPLESRGSVRPGGSHLFILPFSPSDSARTINIAPAHHPDGHPFALSFHSVAGIEPGVSLLMVGRTGTAAAIGCSVQERSRIAVLWLEHPLLTDDRQASTVQLWQPRLAERDSIDVSLRSALQPLVWRRFTVGYPGAMRGDFILCTHQQTDRGLVMGAHVEVADEVTIWIVGCMAAIGEDMVIDIRLTRIANPSILA